MASRRGKPPYVGHRADVVGVEQREEVGEGQRRVSERVDDHPSSVAEGWVVKAWLMVALLLLGCPAPKQFIVQRPGLTCDRATRVAYRTMIALGYTVTSVAPA